MTRTRGELGVTPEEIISHKEIKKNGKYYPHQHVTFFHPSIF